MSIGQRVGDYEILDFLENSKEGVTYKVRNVLLQRFEILRVLPKTLQDDHEAVTRFIREAQVHARMSQPTRASRKAVRHSALRWA